MKHAVVQAQIEESKFPQELFVAKDVDGENTYYPAAEDKVSAVVAYEDDAFGTMNDERFVEVILKPRVTITDAARAEDAALLHERAHALCFIANSCSVPIHAQPVIEVAP